MISGTIQASPMKLCTVIVLLKVYYNTKRNCQKKLDPCKTRQIMYHLKGNDESFFENVVFNEIEFLNQKVCGIWPIVVDFAMTSH